MYRLTFLFRVSMTYLKTKTRDRTFLRKDVFIIKCEINSNVVFQMFFNIFNTGFSVEICHEIECDSIFFSVHF